MSCWKPTTFKQSLGSYPLEWGFHFCRLQLRISAPLALVIVLSRNRHRRWKWQWRIAEMIRHASLRTFCRWSVSSLAVDSRNNDICWRFKASAEQWEQFVLKGCRDWT